MSMEPITISGFWVRDKSKEFITISVFGLQTTGVYTYIYFQVADKSKEFSLLSREQILCLISSPRLLVTSEGAVYKAVVSRGGRL